MAHEHLVYDVDKRFVIDPETRVVKIPNNSVPVLIQYDHNSEYLTFEVKRHVEGHDLLKSNEVEIHFNNVASNNRATSRSVYKVEDLKLDPSNNEKLIFTWAISRNATYHAGHISFVISFSCVDDMMVEYRWNTVPNNDLIVTPGIYNGEAVTQAYADVLEVWRQRLFGISETEEVRILQAAQNIKESIEAKGRETIATIPEEYQELYATIDGLLDEIDDRTLLDETYLEDVTSDFELTNAYVHGGHGKVVDSTSGVVTELIPCSIEDIYFITATSIHQTCCIATYDADGNFLRSYGYNSESEEGTVLTDYKFISSSDEFYVRFASFSRTYDSDYELIIKKQYPMSASKKVETVASDAVSAVNSVISSNVLYGKKYVACGDSFTQGAFSGFVDENGLSSTNSPVIYDKELGMYKTYPWWIAKRNNMTVINEAIGGSDFTNIEGAANPFSVSRYLAVPTDADYVTLMFGLNEVNLTDEQIGTKDDLVNVTLWGAYNIVFEHFLTNMPYAKIGVIIPDAWMTERYSNVVKEICSYWGIPCLDLKNDPAVPMGIYGRFGATNARAVELRDSAFKVTDSNAHPNVKAHEYRSTIIENFLRSL